MEKEENDKKSPQVVSKEGLEKACGKLVYRHLSDNERKKVSELAEKVAEKNGLIINIIEK